MNPPPDAQTPRLKPHIKTPAARPGGRAEDPRWQRVEVIGQAYLRVSRRLAELIAAARGSRP